MVATYVHRYHSNKNTCVCVSLQCVEVAQLLQHLLLARLAHLSSQEHFIYDSVDLHVWTEERKGQGWTCV